MNRIGHVRLRVVLCVSPPVRACANEPIDPWSAAFYGSMPVVCTLCNTLMSNAHHHWRGIADHFSIHLPANKSCCMYSNEYDMGILFAY